MVKEPIADYKTKRRIKVFTSFGEAEEYEIQQILKQNPEDRIRNTVDFILRIHGLTREEMAKRPFNKRITIIKRS